MADILTRQMVKNIKILLSTLALFTLLSCKTYKYNICVYNEKETSEILTNKNLGIADTTMIYIKGKVQNKRNMPIQNATIRFEDKIKNIEYTFRTNQAGFYSVKIPYNNYILKVYETEFGLFSSETLMFVKGEIREINVLLGKSQGYTTYQIKSNKKLNAKRLSEMELEIKNKN